MINIYYMFITCKKEYKDKKWSKKLLAHREKECQRLALIRTQQASHMRQQLEQERREFLHRMRRRRNRNYNSADGGPEDDNSDEIEEQKDGNQLVLSSIVEHSEESSNRSNLFLARPAVRQNVEEQKRAPSPQHHMQNIPLNIPVKKHYDLSNVAAPQRKHPDPSLFDCSRPPPALTITRQDISHERSMTNMDVSIDQCLGADNQKPKLTI